jgi:hypothetical protein
MRTLAMLGLVAMGASASVGCSLPMLDWGTTQTAEGELLGVRASTGSDDVVWRLSGGKAAVVRVPADWRSRPVRTRSLEGGRTVVELQDLLVADSTDLATTGGDETPSNGDVFAPVFGLHVEATTREVLATEPNTRKPIDHTSPGAATRDYLAVVRFEDAEGHLLHVLFGYDPRRLRWVRLSAPVDLGPCRGRVGWALLMLPFCVALDTTALAADLVLTAVLSLGGGGGSVVIFTALNHAVGKAIFTIEPTDHCGPVATPLPR